MGVRNVIVKISMNSWKLTSLRFLKFENIQKMFPLRRVFLHFATIFCWYISVCIIIINSFWLSSNISVISFQSNSLSHPMNRCHVCRHRYHYRKLSQTFLSGVNECIKMQFLHIMICCVSFLEQHVYLKGIHNRQDT